MDTDTQQTVTTALYRKIAIDIARNIAGGKYLPGEKLFGRSVLASHYKVSPETIRKAVYLLKDVGIVDTEQGSGVEVISAQKAGEFIRRYESVETIASVKKEMETWAKEQAAQASEVLRKIQFVIDASERATAASPLNPFQIQITPSCRVIGKSADELKFWHNTGGTIIAIQRGGMLVISPGPYASFQVNDVFYIIGDQDTYSATMKLLFE